MLPRITAVELIRPTTQGRTKPAFLTCITQDQSEVEVITKFSAGCDQKEVNLAFEALASCLAQDLGLPIPKSFIVNIPPDFPATIKDVNYRNIVERSSPVAFGSLKCEPGFTVWSASNKLSDAMMSVAEAIFAFDGIVQNPDRRSDNPNCLVKGDRLVIFDHELCFDTSIVLGWRAPWLLGGLDLLGQPGKHIFRKELRGRVSDLAHVRDAWLNISDARLDAYRVKIVATWPTTAEKIDRGLSLIRDARKNINGCIAEILRVLK